MSDRNHFVYRVWDEFDLLLYIGCTGDPERRWLQHRGDRAPWAQYAHSFKLAGPFLKKDGFARESVAIEAEAPFFNSLKAHRISQRKNNQEFSRLAEIARGRFPVGHSEAAWGTPEFQELMDAIGRAREEADRTTPSIGPEWRLANYLMVRRQAEQRKPFAGASSSARGRKADALRLLRGGAA